MSKYLFEVGVEELPYKFIPMAIDQLKLGFEKFLADNGKDLNEATEGQIQKFLEKNEVLDDVRYAGGLFNYTWRSWGAAKGKTPSGLDFHFDTNNPERWNNLEKMMVEMGKELGQIKLKEIK